MTLKFINSMNGFLNDCDERMLVIIYDDKKLEDIFEPADLARFHL